MSSPNEPRPAPRRRRRLRPEIGSLVVVAVAAAVVCGALALVQRHSGGASALAQTAGATATTADVSAETAATALAGDPPAGAATADPNGAASVDNLTNRDVVGLEPTKSSACKLTVRDLRQGQTGDNVTCLQKALIAASLLIGPATGSFDAPTYAAVRKLQTDRNLFVDGVVGRESAIELGVWPDEASLVVHTPAPPAGAVDPLGFKLSPVASTGASAPPLPANSGSGRRVVYSRTAQRAWAVADDGSIIRSWLVSGSKYNNEQPGPHKVFSHSDKTTAWNGKAILPMMVRYQVTKLGAIGFHGIPIHVADGTAYQTDAELGTRLSGGCQRQDNLDAAFMWSFAQIGTTIFVV